MPWNSTLLIADTAREWQGFRIAGRRGEEMQEALRAGPGEKLKARQNHGYPVGKSTPEKCWQASSSFSCVPIS